MAIYRLQNYIKNYSWGSKHLIPELLNRENTENKPFAELWMGAHPSSPSFLPELSITLIEQAKNSSNTLLGRNSTYSNLPFLFKVLAAETPLSIQAHPSKEQAEKGYKSENEKGIPLSDPKRNYKDANHKPEIICALTPFWAMKGFRKVNQITDHFSLFTKAQDLNENIKSLLNSLNSGSLAGFYKQLMILNTHDSTILIDYAKRTAIERNEIQWQWVSKLSEYYPQDIGILSPLILNLFQLNPGEAMFVPAGQLHAYLSGMGVELMASSDNVLRGGLTPKHIDIPHLLDTLIFKSSTPEIILPIESQPGVSIYKTAAKEFELSRISGQMACVTIVNSSASILINVGNTVRIDSKDSSLTFKKGESVIVEAVTKKFTIHNIKAKEISLFKGSIPQ